MQRPTPGITRNVLAALLAVILFVLAGSLAGPAVASAGPVPVTTGGPGHLDGPDHRDGEAAIGRPTIAVASPARTQAQRDQHHGAAAVLPAGPRTAAPLAEDRDEPAPAAAPGSTPRTGWDSRAPPA